ncbi:uncharacterized protein LOC126667340 [Mercurialis annua]|uniref:uncharacterized protein LOC126667340 n=1 Tax=Mercurialis annua TaxID=3986 RepID=UPI00215DF63F|nr:uncharacterized protein LOC126667340 [Mercurialis annua]
MDSEEASRMSSTTCITDLTDDSLSEILNRITCKSTFVCKSVCKRWFNLISNPDFVSGFIAHQNRHQPPPPELLFGSFGNLTPQAQPDCLQAKPSLSFLPCFDHEKPDNVQIVGSCNDLCLCLDVEKLICYICNPFTNHFAELPPLPSRPLLAGFTCQPYYCSAGAINSEFKFEVVAVFDYGPILSRPHLKQAFLAKYFTSESKQWSDAVTGFIAADVIVNESSLISPAVPHRNKMYWLVKNGIFYYSAYRRRCFRFLPKRTTWMHLGLGRDSLRLFKVYKTRMIIKEIYTLRKFSIIQVDLRNMNMPNDLRNRSITQGKFIGKVIGVSPNDPDTIYLNMDKCSVVSCNLRTDTWNKYDCDTSNLGIHNVVVLPVPYWPTPILSFPSHN